MPPTKSPQTQQPMSKAEKLRARLKKYDKKQTGFFQIEEGNNQIRILPEIGRMEFFFQPVGVHKLDEKTRVYCPKFISEGGLPCPICELVEQQYKFGDKELASEWRVEQKFWMNIISRKNPDAGPLILTAGSMIFQPIISLLNDPDNEDIFDVKKGIDIVISRTGKGKNDTKYTVTPKLKPVPLHSDPKQIKDWLEAAKDLSWTELSDNPEEDAELAKGYNIWVLPYDRIVSEYNLDGLEEGEEDYDEEELVEEGEELEEDDYDEEELVEEEIVEEAPKKKPQIQRIQKPATPQRKRTR